MLPKRLLSAGLFFVPTVLADGAAIVSALKTVASDTAALNQTVVSWGGDILGSLPIVVKSAVLLHGIHSATETAQSSANLSFLEAVSVAVATQGLTADVNITLTNLIAAKPKFDHLLLTPVTLVNLELQRSATSKFSSAVSSKVPSNLVTAANSLAAQIDSLFAEAISVYESW